MSHRSKRNYNATSASELKGWERVQVLIPKILSYGRKEGLIPQVKVDVSAAQAGFSKLIQQAQKEINAQGDKVAVEQDISYIHQAIPFLPLPAAIVCFVCNLLLAGSGTALSGVLSMCIGQPRILVREGRAIASLFVNVVVGCMQLVTITFFLVGWGWSIAWGGIIIVRSVQFRDALRERRKEAVAIAAIEALTKDSILHRRDVKKMVVAKHKQRH